MTDAAPATEPRRPTNADLAELLALASADAQGHRQRAFRRASRRAFLWPVEVTELVAAGGSPTELSGIGPFLGHVLREWIEAEVEAPEPPPIRRGFLTLAQARRILAGSDLRVLGDLQMHSTWSDGGSTVDEMADAAAALGHRYIAITDHSFGLRIVPGLDADGVVAQAAEIARTNERLAGSGSALRVLRSIETNITPEGEVDLDDASLRSLDIVLGSFHSNLRRTEDQTDRYLAAIRHPRLHTLGHPRGRIYNHRLGLTADWDRVFTEAAELDTAVEIDSYPDRQDLDVGLLRVARDAGVRISIGTDAHHAPQLEWIVLGLAAAVEARIASERILNLMEPDALLAWADR